MSWCYTVRPVCHFYDCQTDLADEKYRGGQRITNLLAVDWPIVRLPFSFILMITTGWWIKPCAKNPVHAGHFKQRDMHGNRTTSVVRIHCTCNRKQTRDERQLVERLGQCARGQVFNGSLYFSIWYIAYQSVISLAHADRFPPVNDFCADRYVLSSFNSPLREPTWSSNSQVVRITFDCPMFASQFMFSGHAKLCSFSVNELGDATHWSIIS